MQGKLEAQCADLFVVAELASGTGGLPIRAVRQGGNARGGDIR